MSARGWIVVCLVLGAIGWWYSPLSPRVPPVPAIVLEGQPDTARPGARMACPLPHQVAAGAEPLQSPVPDGFPRLRIGDARLRPLAGLSVDARILSRRDYGYGREAHFSPTDLALGWDRMREDAVVSRMEIRQGGRWYRYRWSGEPPIPAREIAVSSANMHMIPGNHGVAAALRRLRKNQRVRIDGWLVALDASDGWRWRSSLTRDDVGAGACEVVYVCGVTPL